MRKNKNASLLFEVSLAVLLVSIISVFLFRGYTIFSRAGKKSRDYLKLVTLSEEKFWDLQVQEKKNLLTPDMQKQGNFPGFDSWSISLEDEELPESLKGMIITVTLQDNIALDTRGYFNFEVTKE